MSEQMTKYQKNLVRMWDSLRIEDKGACDCLTVRCELCPLDGEVCHNTKMGISFNAEKAITIVEQWAKEHSLVTMRDKYKEVFGVEPARANGGFVCPHSVGFLDVECGGHNCEKCRNEFWNSEYREPKREG